MATGRYSVRIVLDENAATEPGTGYDPGLTKLVGVEVQRAWDWLCEWTAVGELPPSPTKRYWDERICDRALERGAMVWSADNDMAVIYPRVRTRAYCENKEFPGIVLLPERMSWNQMEVAGPKIVKWLQGPGGQLVILHQKDKLF